MHRPLHWLLSATLSCVVLACSTEGESTGDASSGDAGGADDGGRLDGSIRGDGGATGDGGMGLIAEPEAIAQQGDALLVAGAMDGDFFVARYALDGQLDPSFGVEGVTRVDFGGESGEGFLARNIDAAFALAVTTDGILLAGGARGYVGGEGGNLAIAKLTSEGAVDTTFGTNGTVVTSTGDLTSRWHRIVVDGDGRIYAIGTVLNSGGTRPDLVVARYSNGGVIDPSYALPGGGGAGVVWNGGGEDWGIVGELVDGRIVAGGGASFRLTRFDSTGALDPSFGTAGVFSDPDGSFFAATVLPDGSSILAGIAPGDESARNELKIVKLSPSGTLDGSFGSGGVATIAYDLTLLEFEDGQTLDGGFLAIRGIERAEDGDLLLYVSLLGFLNVYPAVARIDLDEAAAVTSFGAGGLAVVQGALPLLGDLTAPEPASHAVRVGSELFLVDYRVDDAHDGLWIGSVALGE